MKAMSWRNFKKRSLNNWRWYVAILPMLAIGAVALPIFWIGRLFQLCAAAMESTYDMFEPPARALFAWHKKGWKK